ncbi:hypothetical protein Tco_0823136 [Tanacetum coccineum]|uniref:Uncharacterized protein n=1 Tax=Tanacetum coccineum TaxID=301880 RepID=A0ABQ5AJM2_9ASTR
MTLKPSSLKAVTGTTLRIGIKPLQNDSDVDQFVNFAYQNKWQVNLYVEHSGYHALDIRDQRETMTDDDNESSDAYCSRDEEDLNYYEPVNANVETVVEDTKNIDLVFNVKEGISYLTHDPNQDWKKMKLVLGMRFHHPEQLKLCLANYGTQESVAANISDKGEIGFGLGDFEAGDNYKSNADLEIPSEEQIVAVTPSADKGKQLAEPSEKPELQPQAIKRGSKIKTSFNEEAPAKKRIIFHKNKGRSERIFNQKMKKSGFGPDREGSTRRTKAYSLM